jgi:hypothetical protein
MVALLHRQGASFRFVGSNILVFLALIIVANPSHNHGRRTGVLANRS